MKLPLLLLTLAFTAPLTFSQQLVPLPRLVTTSGSSVIRVVPDLADLFFEVEVRNANLAVARAQQTERAAKVLSALRAAGVAETELQSSQVQIAPDYTDRRQETETIKFYRVTQSIACTLHEVKKVPDVTAATVTAGATGVREASLRSSQLRKHRDEARANAMKAAKEKAVALASALGATVGKPYTITEGFGYSALALGNTYANNIQAAADPGDPGDGTTPTFAPGTISISANVSVSFVLE